MSDQSESKHSIQQAVQWAVALLKAADARLDAEILLADLLKKDRTFLFAHPTTCLQAKDWYAFKTRIEQRQQGKPIAHLVGYRDFWSLKLQVSPDVLIPRPETEHLVEQALQLGGQATNWQVLDLGTGSGAVALALAQEKPDWHITATDLSWQALALTKQNAQLHQINTVRFIQSDWFNSVNGQFDLIISNPPYIAESDPHLNQGDLRYEPKIALTAGTDGLDCIRLITQQAREYLKPNGCLMFEHGYLQGEESRTLMQQAGYQQVRTVCDLAGHERLTLGRLPNSMSLRTGFLTIAAQRSIVR